MSSLNEYEVHAQMILKARSANDAYSRIEGFLQEAQFYLLEAYTIDDINPLQKEASESYDD